uniref:Seipin n=1 Tax=Labrus bergylta TaxID=56723 RepID=A0A3Q3LFL3_9LABR
MSDVSSGKTLNPVMRKLLRAVIMMTKRIRLRILQIIVVVFVVFLLLWIAAFLYGSFYYSYMPQAAFSTAVHYYYRTDCESPASFSCSYPVANISLMRNNRHVMTFGQAYTISLQLDMPDSPVNQELGMFMIKTACFSRDGEQTASSARSSMLRYRSDLLKQLATLLFLPAFLSGVSEQKQVLEVELFSEYIDDPYSPSVTAIIEILSNKVQIYSSQLLIHAHFTGIRYLLFNFPLTSALVGVFSNFSFLSLLFILSYLRLLFKVDLRPEQVRLVIQKSVIHGRRSARLSVRKRMETEETEEDGESDDHEMEGGEWNHCGGRGRQEKDEERNGPSVSAVQGEEEESGETPEGEDEQAEEQPGIIGGSTSHQWPSPHPILSKLLHSSSTSPCSSMNLSSAESDEVFSEGEEATSKRRTLRKVRLT